MENANLPVDNASSALAGPVGMFGGAAAAPLGLRTPWHAVAGAEGVWAASFVLSVVRPALVPANG